MCNASKEYCTKLLTIYRHQGQGVSSEKELTAEHVESQKLFNHNKRLQLQVEALKLEVKKAGFYLQREI